MRLDRIRIRSKRIKPPVAVLAPKWPYRYQRQHRQFEYSSTLRAMNAFAVAMRTCRHGTSPLRPIPLRDRTLPSICGKARKREITRPPALVAGSSLPSLAIRARFYVWSQTETVLFCTLLQIFSIDLRNPRHRFTAPLEQPHRARHYHRARLFAPPTPRKRSK
jgi:hypothetical protein